MVHSSDFTSTSSLLWFLLKTLGSILTVRQPFMSKELQKSFPNHNNYPY